MVESRASVRLSLNIPVALHIPKGKFTEGWGRILDISTNGLQIETRTQIKIGQVVYLTFVPHGDLRLENLRARVVRVGWEEGYYIAGLYFDDSVDRSYLREALVIILNK